MRKMNTNVIKQQKSALRQQFKLLREQLPQDYRQDADRKIYENVINSMSYKFAKTLLLYASCKGEADTWQILKKAMLDGKKCAFPKTNKDGTMAFYYVQSKNELKVGNFSVPEPCYTLQKVCGLEENALCLVPCLSADMNGFRLGYGKGYYDRYLKTFKGITAILQYEKCISQKPLPSQKRYDVKTDLVITEKKVYVIGQEE